jgi:hypothetical protein
MPKSDKSMQGQTPVKPNGPPPPVKFTGLSLSFLPSIGVAPSPGFPRVNPLPISLGITYFTTLASGNFINLYNPLVNVVAAGRINQFDASQPQVIYTLNDPQNIFTRCPSDIEMPGPIYFLAAPLSRRHVMTHEFLEKLEETKWVRQTGKSTKDGAEEYVIVLEQEDLSKICRGCLRWESLVRTRSGKKKWKYRRWFVCCGCEMTWFCRDECLKSGWHGGHWRYCRGGSMEKGATTKQHIHTTKKGMDGQVQDYFGEWEKMQSVYLNRRVGLIDVLSDSTVRIIDNAEFLTVDDCQRSSDRISQAQNSKKENGTLQNVVDYCTEIHCVENQHGHGLQNSNLEGFKAVDKKCGLKDTNTTSSSALVQQDMCRYALSDMSGVVFRGSNMKYDKNGGGKQVGSLRDLDV